MQNVVADFVLVANVVKAIGLKGEIKLYPMLDWYEPLLEGGWLIWDDGTEFCPLQWRVHGPCHVVSVENVNDRNQADRRVGRKIGFLRSRYSEPGFPKPVDGLPFRWLGRPVHDITGEVLGEVHEVRRYGPQYTLAIMRGEREVLIPAVAPILVDGEGLEGPVIVDPPKGLLDVAGD